MTSNMAAESIWPNYEIGPHKIVFALGVVSINFAHFEWVITWMLAASTTTGLNGRRFLSPDAAQPK
jgi:hypothetical protein